MAFSLGSSATCVGVSRGAARLRLGGEETRQVLAAMSGTIRRQGDVGRLALSHGSLVGLSIRPERVHYDDIDIASEVSNMEPLFAWIVLIAALVALDVAALRWGVDSRDSLPDDHRG
jgi:hypothetical protein